MDPGTAAERPQPTGPEPCEPEAIDFVRFCYRRRRVGWPELYDEMCAVAGRGLYRGYGPDELTGIGIGLTLFEMQALAALVQRVVSEDQARRRIVTPPARPLSSEATVAAADTGRATAQADRTVAPDESQPGPRLVVVAAGA